MKDELNLQLLFHFITLFFKKSASYSATSQSNMTRNVWNNKILKAYITLSYLSIEVTTGAKFLMIYFTQCLGAYKLSGGDGDDRAPMQID